MAREYILNGVLVNELNFTREYLINGSLINEIESSGTPPFNPGTGDKSANLIQTGSGNGFSEFRYDTIDLHTTVDTLGYFNNINDNVDFDVGDTILVVVWDTVVRVGTIASYGMHIVVSVDDATGDVDLSNVTSFVVTNTD